MNKDLDETQIFESIKNIIKKSKFSKDIDISSINEKTDLRELELDSLDFMEYLFAVDEEFGDEISDDVFQEKELAIIENLISYLKSNN